MRTEPNFQSVLPRATKIEYRILAVILLIAFLLRLLSIFVLKAPLESDMLAYDTMARTLLSGAGMSDQDGNRAFFSMGYPFFVLVPTYWLSAGSLMLAKVANCLLGTSSVFLCWLLVRTAIQSPLASLLAAALYAIYLPTFVYASYLLKEHLLIPLILMLLFLSLRVWQERSFGLREACAAGVICGLIALTGNAGLSCALPLFLAVALVPTPTQLKLKAVALAVLVSLLICAPWLMRNHAAIGHAVLNTNTGFNLYIGNNPAATGEFVSIAATPRGGSWQALHSQGEWQAAETLKQEAQAWMRDYPAEFIKLAVRKVWLLWRSPTHSGKDVPSAVESMVRQAWLLQYIVLSVLALYAMVAGWRRYPTFTFGLTLALAGYTSAHMLFYASTRYREAVMPLVCILAALALTMLAKHIPLLRRPGLS